MVTTRYLTPFDPKHVPHYFADVLIIGGGLAGLRAAIAVDSRLSVLVVTKDSVHESNSENAQGGIAGVLNPEDCFKDHIADTITAGGTLCNKRVVETVVREAPERIRELIEWGTRFDRRDGALVLGREGGHGRRRVAHALGDATGKEVMRAVVARTRQLPNVKIWENTFALDLLDHERVCRGVLVFNERHGKMLVWAKQTILAAGGAGQLFRETTNPAVATADGYALANRAGAELRDMEFMQFHPTVLYVAGGARSLITEAVRGEGAWLVDRHGKRFMMDYDSRGELAPRDIVSQAIVNQMEKTQHPNVYLTLRHLDSQFVRERFPGIAETCNKFAIDITRDKIPVRPGAHYMIGGVTVDAEGRTTLPGLWAAGEVTSSGLHGANRLASNSLLEALVYGAHAGHGASQAAAELSDDMRALPLENGPRNELSETLDLHDIRNSLKSLMWRAVGVRRNGRELTDASEMIDRWQRYVLIQQFSDASGWELQNMLTVAGEMVRAALAREESRGVHLRTDFPDTDDQQWRRRLVFRHSLPQPVHGSLDANLH